MLTSKTAINIVQEFVKSCEQSHITFKKVIVFGSVIRNQIHEYSDIDVALVSTLFSGDPYDDWCMLTPIKLSNQKFIDIEPHTFSTKEFKIGDPFIDEIKRTGIEIRV